MDHVESSGSAVESLQDSVFLLELDADSSASKSGSSEGLVHTEDKAKELARLLALGSNEAEAVTEIKRAVNSYYCVFGKRQRSEEEPDNSAADLQELAGFLKKLGLQAKMRHAPGGGHGLKCFEHLQYSFIAAKTTCTDDSAAQDIIVDPSFREQFCFQPSVKWYSQLLELVPEVYIGRAPRLIKIVELMCEAMAMAFSAQGCSTPPWRRRNNVLSKWILSEPSTPTSANDRNGDIPQRRSAPRAIGKPYDTTSGKHKPRSQPQLDGSVLTPQKSVRGFDCSACKALRLHLQQPNAPRTRPAGAARDGPFPGVHSLP